MDVFEVIIKYGCLFYFGAFGGWIIELFYRRIFSQKQWVNPGFLTGPIVPLYGLGIVLFYFFANEIQWPSAEGIEWLITIGKTLLVGLLMTAIEFVAGLVFIKGLKIKLWDYSMRPGNIQGLICPLFTAIWLACAAIYMFLVNPLFVQATSFISTSLLPFGMLISFFNGIFVVDFFYTLDIVGRIRKAVSDKHLIVYWENLKVAFSEYRNRAEQHLPWLLSFKTKKEEFSTLINAYVEKLRHENMMKAEEKQRLANIRRDKR